VGLYFDESGIPRAPQNPTIDHLVKELGKDRNDVEAKHPRVAQSGGNQRQSKI
jgi:hypothetical protein